MPGFTGPLVAAQDTSYQISEILPFKIVKWSLAAGGPKIPHIKLCRPNAGSTKISETSLLKVLKVSSAEGSLAPAAGRPRRLEPTPTFLRAITLHNPHQLHINSTLTPQTTLKDQIQSLLITFSPSHPEMDC